MARVLYRQRSKRLSKGRVNAGVIAQYEAALRLLIARMQRDVTRTIAAHYKKAEPQIAEDANPITALRTILDKLRSKWARLFDEQASALAEQFVKRNQNDTEANLRKRLKRAGFEIVFKPNANLQRRIKLAVADNVVLIKSIGEQYLNSVSSLVTEAVLAGGDLGTLSKKLQSRYGVSERRAAVIANDQTHKINQAVERMRCQEIGLTEAYWRHVGGGRHPRPDHVQASGRRYNVAKGCEISGDYIQPGQLINCHCRAEYIIPGYNN